MRLAAAAPPLPAGTHLVMAPAAVATGQRATRARVRVRAPRGLGFGSSLRGSAPAGNGTSAVAFDPSTDTIYAANGNNANGANAGREHGVGDRRPALRRAVGARLQGPLADRDSRQRAQLDRRRPGPSHGLRHQRHENTVSVIDARPATDGSAPVAANTRRLFRSERCPIGRFVDDATHTLYVAQFRRQHGLDHRHGVVQRLASRRLPDRTGSDRVPSATARETLT